MCETIAHLRLVCNAVYNAGILAAVLVALIIVALIIGYKRIIARKNRSLYRLLKEQIRLEDRIEELTIKN